jgi:hypothetical protein
MKQLVCWTSDCPKVTVLRPENITIMRVTNVVMGIGNILVDLSITSSIASIIKLIWNKKVRNDSLVYSFLKRSELITDRA